MTPGGLYEEGKSRLEDAGVDDAPLNARLLLQNAFSLSLGDYLLTRGKELPDTATVREDIAFYRDCIERRALRIPIQLIVGRTQFSGLEFTVRENVLIPRQDTETLVEQVLLDLDSLKADKGGEDLTLLDLCTGSGCIAVSLAVKGNFSRIAAADISGDALDNARENAARYGLDTIEFYQGDLFSALPRQTPPFSVITVNPPYIPTGVIPALQPEVKDHEPWLALDGSIDGLEFYRRIAAGAGPYLARGGRIYLEIGCDQGSDVKAIFRSAGFENVTLISDLSGKERVAVVSK